MVGETLKMSRELQLSALAEQTRLSAGMRLPCVSEELIEYGILPRLPVKALLRFQCVCRRWHRLISSDPYFIHLQYRNAPSGLLLLIDNQRRLMHDEEVKFISGDSRSINILNQLFPNMLSWRPVASCNGLVCLFCCRDVRKLYVRKLKLYVGNPSLRDWKLLPDYESESEDFYPWSFGLAVDVGESGVCYKLVVLLFLEDVEDEIWECKFVVFSSTTGLWEVSKERAYFTLSTAPVGKAAYVKGVLYWNCQDRLLWFDCINGGCGFHQWPPGSSNNWPGSGPVTELNDELRLCRISNIETIDIWSMDRCCWVKKASFSLEKIINDNPEVFASPELGMHPRWKAIPHCVKTSIFPMPLWNDSTITFYMGREISIAKMIYSYNMETGEARKQSKTFNPYNWFSYKTCLVPSPNI